MKFEVSLNPAEMEYLRTQVVESIVSEICKISPASLRKHAYTVKEVAEQIGYSTKTVLGFIHEGRTARNGKQVKLLHKEITPGDYRILPADLDKFLDRF